MYHKKKNDKIFLGEGKEEKGKSNSGHVGPFFARKKNPFV